MPTILLALDARTQLDRLLPAALWIAAKQHATLKGLFARDKSLLRGVALACTYEVGSSSAVCYSVSAKSMEARMRHIAEHMRQRLSAAATRNNLPFEFQICEGSLAAITNDASAEVVFPGWASEHSAASAHGHPRLTSRSISPLIVVVDDGTPAAVQAVEFARRLTELSGTHRLVIFLLPQAKETGGLILHSSDDLHRLGTTGKLSTQTTIPVGSINQLARQLLMLRPALLLLGRDQTVVSNKTLQQQSARINCPTALLQS